MQVSRTTSVNDQNTKFQPNQNASTIKTDEYLFQENNKAITFKADIADPTTNNSAPAIIGALLSTFADEVISFLGMNNDNDVNMPEDEETDKIPPTSSTTNYIA